MTLILRQQHGLQLDHIGLGVPDTEAGVAEIEKLTGARVALDPPEPDQWYWSGELPLAADSFLEVIGPNPTNDLAHPLRPYIENLTTPSVHFWYVGVSDMDAVDLAAREVGGSVIFRTPVNAEDDPSRSRYTFAGLGPDFVLQKPSLIDWQRQIHRREFGELPVVCSVAAFELFHPTADRINPILERLGLDQRVQSGPSRFRLVLDTPNGEIVFDNPGVDAAG